MPKLMKESEAWREIARRLAEGSSSPHLCANAWDLMREDTISARMRCEMKDRVYAHMDTPFPEAEGCACWRTDVGQERNTRVLAALFLSYEAEEEGR